MRARLRIRLPWRGSPWEATVEARAQVALLPMHAVIHQTMPTPLGPTAGEKASQAGARSRHWVLSCTSELSFRREWRMRRPHQQWPSPILLSAVPFLEATELGWRCHHTCNFLINCVVWRLVVSLSCLYRSRSAHAVQQRTGEPDRRRGSSLSLCDAYVSFRKRIESGHVFVEETHRHRESMTRTPANGAATAWAHEFSTQPSCACSTRQPYSPPSSSRIAECVGDQTALDPAALPLDISGRRSGSRLP